MRLKDQYRSKVRRSSGLLLGWCGLGLITALSVRQTENMAAVVGGVAIVSGIVALILTRRIMRLSCPACGANLYWSLRGAIRGNTELQVCPHCGGEIQV